MAAAVVLLPLGAGLTYLALGSPNLAPASMNVEAGGSQLPEGIEQTVAEVEKYLEANPKNGRGWELLAPVYLRLGRFDDAVRARRNALDIFGPDAARLGDLGEAIVLASNGAVTPEAKGLFERASAADPEDVMAQYYLGLSAKQEGRRDEAVKRWTALVSNAREGRGVAADGQERAGESRRERSVVRPLRRHRRSQRRSRRPNTMATSKRWSRAWPSA